VRSCRSLANPYLSPSVSTLCASRHGAVTPTQERAAIERYGEANAVSAAPPLAAFIAGVPAAAIGVMHIAFGSHWRLARPSRDPFRRIEVALRSEGR